MGKRFAYAAAASAQAVVVIYLPISRCRRGAHSPADSVSCGGGWNPDCHIAAVLDCIDAAIIRRREGDQHHVRKQPRVR